MIIQLIFVLRTYETAAKHIVLCDELLMFYILHLIGEITKSLSYAKRLRKKLKPPLTEPLYHTMIAAFGHCGDLETAFALVDEMKTKMVVNSDTMCHLLHACNSDKNSGFKLSLTVFRRMLHQNMKPNLDVFKLLLRATQKCGIGKAEVVNDLLLEAMTSQQAREFKTKMLSNRHLSISSGKKKLLLFFV